MSIIKVAVTGGPSGGKTTLIEALKKELGQMCAIVPEAASILYRGGFPRYKDAEGQIHAQKAIYHTQRELEDLISFQSQKNLLVCDRGSLDSIAYWPQQDEQHFFATIQSSKEKEWARYNWVLHLDTASLDYYDTTNPIRTESYQEAQTLNERVKKAWEGHPHRVIITQNSDFLSKMTTSLAVIRAIMAHQNIADINKLTALK
jgi:nicotinamide riboside kinase